MPQSWEKHWPLPDGFEGDEHQEAEAARRDRIHRLGNLTLTTLPLNSALSHSSWPAKQKQLNKWGKLLLNARLVEEHPETFDEAAIDVRGDALARRICAIWPGPNAW